MASAQMAEEFIEELEAHLPPEQPLGRKGGRPPIAHTVVIRVIWFVLCSGCCWEDVPAEMNCFSRTAHRRLRQWEELSIWDRLQMHLLKLLRKNSKLDPRTAVVDSVIVRAIGGGDNTGPRFIHVADISRPRLPISAYRLRIILLE